MKYDIDEIKKNIPKEDHEFIPTEKEMEEIEWVWYTIYEVIEWRKKMAQVLLDMSWWVPLDVIEKIINWLDEKEI